jgi:hypothetical protein
MENKKDLMALQKGLLQTQSFPLNQVFEFNLDKKNNWVKEILLELIGSEPEGGIQNALDHSSLNLNFTLQKLHNTRHDSHFVLNGSLNLHFQTECIKTLRPMFEEIKLKLDLCFLSEAFAQKTGMIDETEIFINEKLMELFFYKDDNLDLKATVVELIEVNRNPYPTLISDEENSIQKHLYANIPTLKQ